MYWSLALSFCVCVFFMFLRKYLSRVGETLPSGETILSEFAEIRDHMTSLRLPLVMCHNDVWLGNIIHNKQLGKVIITVCIKLS